MSTDDFCMKCLKDGAKNAVSADVYRDRKASLKKLAEAALAGSCPDGPSYSVSKAWYAKCILLLISNLGSAQLFVQSNIFGALRIIPEFV